MNVIQSVNKNKNQCGNLAWGWCEEAIFWGTVHASDGPNCYHRGRHRGIPPDQGKQPYPEYLTATTLFFENGRCVVDLPENNTGVKAAKESKIQKK